jgi:hypothetical protein
MSLTGPTVQFSGTMVKCPDIKVQMGCMRAAPDSSVSAAVNAACDDLATMGSSFAQAYM